MPPRAAGVVGLCVVLALGSGLLFQAQRDYLRTRYHGYPEWRWAEGLRGSRIGVVNRAFQYPFYGRDLGNHVQYVGQIKPRGAFLRASSCAEWRRLLNEGRYRYVVLNAKDRELAWTRLDPGAQQIISGRTTFVFLREEPSDVAACPA